MQYRSWIGRQPRITFTHDFHELLRGDLVPGCRVVLRYDPLRIVLPDDGYIFGDPARPVTAHVAFHRGEREDASIVLASPAGMLRHPDIDVTGSGSVLRGEIDVPSDAEELCVWFTYNSPRTGLHLDDDGGRKFRFRFASVDLMILSAAVVPSSALSERDNAARPSGNWFALEVSTRPEIDRIGARLSLVNHPEFAKTELDLAAAGRGEEGWLLWTLRPVEVPEDAIVRYKLYYWIDGTRYKDDNSGDYYLAPLPPPEKVPPPPRELFEAAKRWA